MTSQRQRLDKWLCYARVVKTRTLAAGLVEAGHVRVNGIRSTASAKVVGPGDVLTIALERSVRVLRIVDVGDRRGPFREASKLFEEIGEAGAAGPGPALGGAPGPKEAS